MYDYTFGNFLYSLRNEKGLSQAQLGELLGVTNKAVSKWENGSAKPNTILIPRIAEIFGITVEELFACKRLKKDCEYEKIMNYLSSQKRKNAIISSVFLSIIIILPLLLIEFICVLMGFHLPDAIAGPLGSVGFIFAFIISLTAFVIYRKNFIQSITPSEIGYTPKFVGLVKKGLLVTAIAWWFLVVLLLPIYLVILSFSSDFVPANIYLAIVVFVLIVLFGVFICFANIKRLLKIKLSMQTHREQKSIRFSNLPIWAKICYVSTIILSPFVLSFQILGIHHSGWLLAKCIFLMLYLTIACPLIIYNIKNK